MARRAKPLAESVIRRLESLGKGRRIDPEIAPTDRLLRRWASSIGSGLPSEEVLENPKSTAPPLDDETAVVVDQIILRSPGRTSKLIRLWYKSNQPRESIAEMIGVSRSAVFVEHKAALWYLRGRFHAAGIDC